MSNIKADRDSEKFFFVIQVLLVRYDQYFYYCVGLFDENFRLRKHCLFVCMNATAKQLWNMLKID